MRLERIVRPAHRRTLNTARFAIGALICATVAAVSAATGADAVQIVAVAEAAATNAAPTTTATAPTDPIKAAVADPSRTAEDRTRDERDHAVDVLTFFGIK